MVRMEQAELQKLKHFGMFFLVASSTVPSLCSTESAAAAGLETDFEV